jgi:hypothetical protein
MGLRDSWARVVERLRTASEPVSMSGVQQFAYIASAIRWCDLQASRRRAQRRCAYHWRMDTGSALPTAIAFRLLGHLDIYEDQIRQLAEAWPDDGAYAEVSALMNLMRAEAASLPKLMAQWVEFMISHTETIQCLSNASALSTRLDRLERHIAHLLDLQARCLAMIAPDAGPRLWRS